jgi:hypothetical protein
MVDTPDKSAIDKSKQDIDAVIATARANQGTVVIETTTEDDAKDQDAQKAS